MATTRERTEAGRVAREREMRELLALREAEGLTLRQLAEVRDVPTGTLSWWAAELRRRDRVRAAEPRPEFVELVIEGGDAVDDGDVDEDLCFEVALEGGLRVVVPARYGLARLVRDLRAC